MACVNIHPPEDPFQTLAGNQLWHGKVQEACPVAIPIAVPIIQDPPLVIAGRQVEGRRR